MSGGARQRPWQRPWVWAAEQTAREGWGYAERPVQHAATDAVLHGTREVISRAARAAAEDRSLDIIRDYRMPPMDYYEPRPWYEKRPGPLAEPKGRIQTLKPAGPLRCKNYVLRAISNPVTRGIGKVLGYSIKGVPVVGTAIEMLHSSPLADGTLTAAGRQMMNRYWTGRDPFKGMINLTDHDRRRATAFMDVGINPLRPGYNPEGLRNVYAGDYKPDQPVGGNVNMVFDADWVHRSPQIVPMDRSRPLHQIGPKPPTSMPIGPRGVMGRRQPNPWAAVGGPPVFGPRYA